MPGNTTRFDPGAGLLVDVALIVAVDDGLALALADADADADAVAVALAAAVALAVAVSL